MAATIIDGRAIANELLDALKDTTAKRKRPPVLAIILAGDNPASIAYIRQKQKSATYIGIQAHLVQFDATITEAELLEAIRQIEQGQFRANGVIFKEQPDAMIVQRPLPAHINDDTIIKAVPAYKDVDGFHPKSPFDPPVAEAVIEILKTTLPKAHPGSHLRGGSDSIKGLVGDRRIVLVGYGETAGKPIAQLLEKYTLAFDLIRSKTKNPQAIARSAHILISAVGKPGIITSDWVKPGAVVIDVGTNRITDDAGKTRLKGDCDTTVAEVAGFLTPVPGGVGPVNVACLMQNVVAAKPRN